MSIDTSTGPGAGAGTGDVGGSRRRRKGSKGWLVAFPLVAALIGWGLWSFSDSDGDSSPKVASGPAPKLEAVAVQAADLPSGWSECRFSGEVTSYIRNMRGAGTQQGAREADAVQRIWDQLRQLGATGAYVTFWFDDPSACDIIQGRTEMQHAMGSDHPNEVVHMLFSFPDAERAAAAFHSGEQGFFGQKVIQEDDDWAVRKGDATGLGPNSVLRSTKRLQPPQTRGIWQAGAWASRVITEDMTPEASQEVMAKIKARMDATVP